MQSAFVEEEMQKLRHWAREPTSVAGFATILGTCTAMLSHQLTWAQAIPLMIGALVSIALPDNTGARAGAVALASALVSKFNPGEEKA